MHPITDGIDNFFCRKRKKERKKERGEWKQSIIIVPASNNKYPHTNGNKRKRIIFLRFFLSIHLFRTLLLYQINKLMHDAHISKERRQMLSLLCGDIFFVSRQHRHIPNIMIHLLHLMIYCKKRERGKRNYPNNTFYLSNSGVAGAKGILLERQFI